MGTSLCRIRGFGNVISLELDHHMWVDGLIMYNEEGLYDKIDLATRTRLSFPGLR